jgi:nitrogen regulatory protein PII
MMKHVVLPKCDSGIGVLARSRDGKIFFDSHLDVIRIRTGEEGNVALQ